MPFRFASALLIAAILIGGGCWFVGSTRRELAETMRRSLHAMKAAGTLPSEYENADLDTVPLEGMNVQVSPEMVTKLRIADWLQALCWIWIPVVVGICLLVAVIAGWAGT